jgi:succinate dehydrogenase/fumarate reductase flavoprotein subunit
MIKQGKLTDREISELIKKNKKLKEEKYLEDSKKRLNNICEKKIKTAFIGAIAAFEEYFGKLWGINKELKELSKDEQKYNKLWEQVRIKILNNGNNQLRALKNELEQYTIKWNRYNLTTVFFNLKNEKDED